MSRSNVGNTKPHIFKLNGWWRVTRHVKPFPIYAWNQANNQTINWNNNTVSSELKKPLQT